MENIALESDKQKQFLKSIKGIKKLIKKGDEPKIKKASIDKTQDVETTRVKKNSRKERGLVYLSHIPHGFYEHEMTQYFKQFGVVTNARVIRSKRTGNSKGYAFVEFRDPAVGQIVAETMNNYLMGKRLIKAAYIPPEKQRRYATRKRWDSLNNPGREARLKLKKAYNRNKNEQEELEKGRKILKNLLQKKKQLEELNINYDFFQPVDVPDTLKHEMSVKENEKSVEDVSKDNKVSTSRKPKKEKVAEDNEVKEEFEIKPDTKLNGKGKTVEVKQNKSNVVVKENSNKKKGKKEPICLMDSEQLKEEKEESVVANSKSKKNSKKGKVTIETEVKKELQIKSDIKLNGKGKTVEVKQNKSNVVVKENSNKKKVKKEPICLMDSEQLKEEKEESVVANSKSKKNSKKGKVTIENEVKKELQIKLDIKLNGKGKTVEFKQNKSNVVIKESSNKQKGKKESISHVDSEQAAKQKKLNEAGVKPLEEFIKVEQDSDNDSDLTYEFDSDEYEKFMENNEDDSDYSENDNDDTQDISNESGSDDDEATGNIESDEESSEEVVCPKKGKIPMVLAPMALKKLKGKQNIKMKPPQQMKRKTPQNTEFAPKKFKGEKQEVQKPMKKQFKKKK